MEWSENKQTGTVPFFIVHIVCARRTIHTHTRTHGRSHGTGGKAHRCWLLMLCACYFAFWFPSIRRLQTPFISCQVFFCARYTFAARSVVAVLSAHACSGRVLMHAHWFGVFLCNLTLVCVWSRWLPFNWRWAYYKTLHSRSADAIFSHRIRRSSTGVFVAMFHFGHHPRSDPFNHLQVADCLLGGRPSLSLRQ